MLEMPDDFFFHVKGNDCEAAAGTVRGCCRCCNVFISWCEALSLDLGLLSVFQVAAFIRDRGPQGKSVPV